MLSRSRRQVVPLALVGLGACLTPPAMMPAVSPDAALAIELYPAGTERVELAAADGSKLHGILVPAGEGAPVVLHLLESSGSPTSLKLHYEVLCRQLRDLGFASLLVDYRGVGASEGEPSPRHLAEDARAMWSEALARAGGDPARVALRGISIGTLAAGLLLEEGAQPGLVLLHAPVFADSAVKRFARTRHGAFVAWWAGILFAELAPIDLPSALARCPAPLLVIAGDQDFFVSKDDRARLEAAVCGAGGVWSSRPCGHLHGSILAHALLPEELELLVERFPPPPLDEAEADALFAGLPEDALACYEHGVARERLLALARLARHADSRLRAAVALANEPDLDALRLLWMVEERSALGELPFDELVQALSLDDPAGRLPIEAIEEASLLCDLNDRFGGGAPDESVGFALVRVRAALEGVDSQITFSLDVGWDRARFVSSGCALVEGLRGAGFPEEALTRIAMRVILKGKRIPERVRIEQDGRVVLEILEEGRWRELDLDAPPPALAFGGSIPRALGRRASELVEREQASGAP